MSEKVSILSVATAASTAPTANTCFALLKPDKAFTVPRPGTPNWTNISTVLPAVPSTSGLTESLTLSVTSVSNKRSTKVVGIVEAPWTAPIRPAGTALPMFPKVDPSGESFCLVICAIRFCISSGSSLSMK